MRHGHQASPDGLKPVAVQQVQSQCSWHRQQRHPVALAVARGQCHWISIAQRCPTSSPAHPAAVAAALGGDLPLQPAGVQRHLGDKPRCVIGAIGLRGRAPQGFAVPDQLLKILALISDLRDHPLPEQREERLGLLRIQRRTVPPAPALGPRPALTRCVAGGARGVRRDPCGFAALHNRPSARPLNSRMSWP